MSVYKKKKVEKKWLLLKSRSCLRPVIGQRWGRASVRRVSFSAVMSKGAMRVCSEGMV